MADDETSIWKKEISFRRKPKSAEGRARRPPEAAQAAPGEPEAKTSVWKKEIVLAAKASRSRWRCRRSKRRRRR